MLPMFLLSPILVFGQTSEIDELRGEVKKLRILIEELSIRVEKLAGSGETRPKEPVIKPTPFPCPVFEKELIVGKSDTVTNGEVSKLQSFLKSTGDYTYPEVTGYFGAVTETALKSWQQKNGAKVLGVVNSETKEIIKTRCLPPKSDIFTASPLSGKAPLSVSFKAVAESNVPTERYYVSFGDGSESKLEEFIKETCPVNTNADTGVVVGPKVPCIARTSMTANHIYKKAGSYLATLNKRYSCKSTADTVCIALESEVVAELKVLVK